MSSNPWVVCSYGNSDMVADVLRVVSGMLVGDGSFAYAALRLSAAFALFFVIVKSFYKPDFEGIFLSIARVAILPAVLFSYTCTVLVEDALVDGASETYKVDRVPAPLAIVASCLSRAGCAITREFEWRMHHILDDTNYSCTARIWGADVVLQGRQWVVIDPCLRENLEEIGRVCVQHGLSLGHYTVDELRSAPDLIEFLQRHAPKILVLQIWKRDDSGCQYRELLPSEEAIAEVRRQLFESVSGLGSVVDRRIPSLNSSGKEEATKIATLFKAVNVWNAIPELSSDSTSLLRQQIACDSIRCGFNGHDWALGRARVQQEETMSILACLSPRNVIAFRAVLECIAYAMFVIIVITCLLPGGIQRIIEWCKFFAWIQLIPVTFVMVSYFYDYPSRIEFGTSGYSIENLDSLKYWYDDIKMQAGALMAMVPFLTYIMFFGSPSQMVHLAGSIFSPTHQAASAAASEAVSGNYSYGNVSLGNRSTCNETYMQMQRAPSLSSGFSRIENGQHSITYTDEGGCVVQQHDSSLKGNLGLSSSINTSLSHQLDSNLSRQESIQETLSSAYNDESRCAASLCDSVGDSFNYSSSQSLGEGGDHSQSIRQMVSVVDSYGKRYGLNRDNALGCVASAKQGLPQFMQFLSGLGGGIEESASFNSRSNHMYEDALSVSNSREFSEGYSDFQNWAKTEASAHSNEKVRRLSEDFVAAHAQSESLSNSYQNLVSRGQRISDLQSSIEQMGSHWSASLNQKFLEWGSDQFGDTGAFLREIEDPMRKVDLQQEFSGEITRQMIQDGLGVSHRSVDRSVFDDLSVNTDRIEVPSFSLGGESIKERLSSVAKVDVESMGSEWQQQVGQELLTEVRSSLYATNVEKGSTELQGGFKEMKSKVDSHSHIPDCIKNSAEQWLESSIKGMEKLGETEANQFDWSKPEGGNEC